MPSDAAPTCRSFMSVIVIKCPQCIQRMSTTPPVHLLDLTPLHCLLYSVAARQLFISRQATADCVFPGTLGSMDACKGFGTGASRRQTLPGGQPALAKASSSSSSPRRKVTARPGWTVTSIVASLPCAGTLYAGDMSHDVTLHTEYGCRTFAM